MSLLFATMSRKMASFVTGNDGSTSLPITMYNKALDFLCNIQFRTHLIISILIRVVLIFYGEFHDKHSEVPYTDIDYRVVTDGARQILKGNSPFQRHTYRYSPILAFMQIPNIIFHPAIGKIIYSSFDIFVAILIYVLVRSELQSQCHKAVQSLLMKMGKVDTLQSKYPETDERNRPKNIAKASACFWLYNPLTAVISTRGNGDSFSSFFVILTIYLLSKSEDAKGCNKMLIFAAGLSHGFAIHLRLYPLLFSLAYFLRLSNQMSSSFKKLLKQILLPSKKQLTLILGTFLSLSVVTGFFYHLYGWQYLYEAYFYHFIRKDVRHNFSLYFLMQYLSSSMEHSILQYPIVEKILIQAPQFCLLLYLSISFGQFRQTLPFCIFSLAFIMVTFNSVVTSQYFVWYLALLPLCLNNLQSISLRKGFGCFLFWLLGQGLWLLPAYLLEFKTFNTFYWIGAQSALFFLINIFILIQLIQNYSFTSYKFNIIKLLKNYEKNSK